MDKIKQKKLSLYILIISLSISYCPQSFCQSEFNGEFIVFPFLDAEYNSNLDSASSRDNDEYDYGADLFATFEYEKIRFLGEYLLSKHEKDFERFQVGWEFDNNNMIWLGRFHNPIGFWNTNYHHGDYLETAISRPAIVEFEDFGGLLPMHLAGLLIEGVFENAEHGVGYAVAVAAGPGYTDKLEPWSITSPSSGSQDISASFNLFYEPELYEPTRYGLFANYNEIPAVRAGFDEIQQLISGAYLNWQSDHWHFISSVFYIHNQLDRLAGGSSSESFVNGYIQSEYIINDKYTLYGRLERTAGDQNDIYLGLFPDFIEDRLLGGIRFDFIKQNALKFEVSDNQTNSDNFYQFMMQWSSVF